MASTASSYNPSRDDFAAMLDESFAGGNLQESSVIKGIVVAIEKDMAVIDVGLKTEGRVALREFAGPGKESELKVGDEVEVFLDRIENALGEAVLSRDKARREESWGKLEKAFNNNEKVHGVIFNQVKGGFTVDLDGAVAFLPRSQVDIRPIRGVAPHGSRRDPRRAAPGTGAKPRRGPGHRRRRQEYHRLRRVRRSRRHRRPLARHRYRLAPGQSPDRSADHRPDREGHEHHRLRRVRRTGAGHRRPDPRLGNVVDQKEHASRQDRLHLAGSRSAGFGSRFGQAPYFAGPQADHA